MAEHGGGVVLADAASVVYQRAALHRDRIFQRRDPKTVWTWLLAIYFIPVFGVAFYLLFGQDMKKSRMFRVKEADDRLKFPIKSQEAVIRSERREDHHPDAMTREYSSLVLYNLETSGAVLTSDNAVDIYTDGREKFEALRQALRGPGVLSTSNTISSKRRSI